MNQDELFMNRCLQLAQKGRGQVAPNPMVGSVIVYRNKIIGEGYHRKYGEAHAEVNAINSVNNKSLLKNSTIYVTLEPCAHTGKTPPCADLIIKHKIPNVVIGMKDPFSKVNGLGISRMRNSGCNVIIGTLEQKCIELNREFITFHTQKRPYVILKWAQTLDGLIDKERGNNYAIEPNWITNEVCRSLVHKWRTEIQSIMVGTNTAKNDNPKLNIRSWVGKAPLRIVIDKELKLSKELYIFDQTQPTLVLNKSINKVDDLVEYVKIKFNENFPKNLMSLLYSRNISSLFVEGGEKLLNTFIESNYWDEARVFTGNRYFNKGVSAPFIKGKILSIDKLQDNVLTVIENTTN